MKQRRIFIGMDSRQPVAGMVLISSILRHARQPVSITPLLYEQVPIKRKGLTGFTYARYLVPWLCGFEGGAIFMDADMIVTTDITCLLTDPICDTRWGNAVWVCDHTAKFERPSLMGFWNPKCAQLTPQYIEDESNHPQDFSWAKGGVGTLDPCWNFCVGYDEPWGTSLQPGKPNVIHYTAGIPLYRECRNLPYADLWLEEYRLMLETCSWLELMGPSVHAKMVLKSIHENPTNGGYVDATNN